MRRAHATLRVKRSYRPKFLDYYRGAIYDNACQMRWRKGSCVRSATLTRWRCSRSDPSFLFHSYSDPFYNGWGIAEQWIKEGKYTLKWTRLSCHRFVANQVRLQLFILAYQPGQLPAEADAAQGCHGMVPAECAAQACQDRGQAGEACPALGLSDG
jgi:Transposase DDE domain group 1